MLWWWRCAKSGRTRRGRRSPRSARRLRATPLGFEDVSTLALASFASKRPEINAAANETIVGAIEAEFAIVPAGVSYIAGIWNDPNGDGDPADAQLLWSVEGTTTDDDQDETDRHREGAQPATRRETAHRM